MRGFDNLCVLQGLRVKQWVHESVFCVYVQSKVSIYRNCPLIVNVYVFGKDLLIGTADLGVLGRAKPSLYP
jgi:hypothetical protein